MLKHLDEYRLLSFDISGELKEEKGELKEQKENTQHSYYDASEAGQVSNFALSVFGHGELVRKIEHQAKKENFKKVTAYLYKDKIDIEKAVMESDFSIVDANEWSPFHIELINEMALKHNKPWLYVGGLEETSIKIGPLFYGKETGCYNCLISRLKSNHEYPAFLNSYEDYLKTNKQSAKPDIFPNLDIIYNIVRPLHNS